MKRSEIIVLLDDIMEALPYTNGGVLQKRVLKLRNDLFNSIPLQSIFENQTVVEIESIHRAEIRNPFEQAWEVKIAGCDGNDDAPIPLIEIWQTDRGLVIQAPFDEKLGDAKELLVVPLPVTKLTSDGFIEIEA